MSEKEEVYDSKIRYNEEKQMTQVYFKGQWWDVAQTSGVQIDDKVLEQISAIWKTDNPKDYVEAILKAYIENVLEETDKISITSPFILIPDPALEDEMVIFGKETDDKYIVRTTGLEAYIEESERYQVPLECIQLQDTIDPNIKFTMRINSLTSEYDIVGGWEELEKLEEEDE